MTSVILGFVILTLILAIRETCAESCGVRTHRKTYESDKTDD
jgi:hypothetical protein